MTIRLYKLALACFAFDALTHYNSALSELRRTAGLPVNLTDSNHQPYLLTWLNKWGTRMPGRVFKSVDLEAWYRQYQAALPPAEKHLWKLSDQDMQGAECAYSALCTIKGWGGTAASKVLFAARPEALPPWDDAARKEFKVRREASSYGEFLAWCREQTRAIKFECEQAGLHISDLPGRLNQPDATVAMLINQYVWVMYSKNRPFPKAKDIRQWAKWSE